MQLGPSKDGTWFFAYDVQSCGDMPTEAIQHFYAQHELEHATTATQKKISLKLYK